MLHVDIVRLGGICGQTLVLKAGSTVRGGREVVMRDTQPFLR